MLFYVNVTNEVHFNHGVSNALPMKMIPRCNAQLWQESVREPLSHSLLSQNKSNKNKMIVYVLLPRQEWESVLLNLDHVLPSVSIKKLPYVRRAGSHFSFQNTYWECLLALLIIRLANLIFSHTIFGMYKFVSTFYHI